MSTVCLPFSSQLITCRLPFADLPACICSHSDVGCGTKTSCCIL